MLGRRGPGVCPRTHVLPGQRLMCPLAAEHARRAGRHSRIPCCRASAPPPRRPRPPRRAGSPSAGQRQAKTASWSSTSSPCALPTHGCANAPGAGPTAPTRTCLSASRLPSTPASRPSAGSPSRRCSPLGDHTGGVPRRPHPRRGPSHRRPRPPHAAVRHRRQHRDEVRLHRPPRTPSRPAPIAGLGLSGDLSRLVFVVGQISDFAVVAESVAECGAASPTTKAETCPDAPPLPAISPICSSTTRRAGLT
jgi:hypothetical protein